MKKATLFICIAVLALTLALVSSQTVQAGVAGTAHDFSAAGWNTSGELCAPCHTPHNSNSHAPLWDREVSTGPYTLYTSWGLDATLVDPSVDSKSSLECLSCHDGTIAIDSYGGATGTTFVSAANNVGTDLSDDHPIGFVYQEAIDNGDTGLVDAATVQAAGLLISFPGQVECGSCHDVHDDAGNAKLLKMSNANSALCTACHVK